jgi:hypothetical protein
VEEEYEEEDALVILPKPTPPQVTKQAEPAKLSAAQPAPAAASATSALLHLHAPPLPTVYQTAVTAGGSDSNSKDQPQLQPTIDALTSALNVITMFQVCN